MGVFDRLSSVLDRKATDVSNYTWGELFPGYVKSGVSVNVWTALRTTTVLACSRVISEGIAQMPIGLFDIDQEKNTKIKNLTHPAYHLLACEPNEWMTAFEMREMMTMHAVLTGNAYAYLGWAGVGPNRKLIEIIPLMPHQVVVNRESDYSITYSVTDLAGLVTTLSSDSILHLRGPSWDGYLGLDAVQLAREAIGLAIATEETHASLHANGAQPGGVLTVKSKLDKDARARLKEQWQNFQGGVANKFKTAVLDMDADWKSLSMSGVDSQHLETRRFQIEEICRAMRVFPQLVMHSDKTSTFASAEAFFLAHVTHSLMPWIIRWEQAINRTILGDDENLVCKLNVASMMRGDAKTRAMFYQSALGGARGETAWMTRNEVRELEDLNPIDGGDKLPMPQPAPVGFGGGSGNQTLDAGAADSGAKAFNEDQPRDDHGRWGFGSMIASYAKAAVINTALGLFGLDILPTWAVAGIIESRKSSDITEEQFNKWYVALSVDDKKRLHDEVVSSLTKEQRTALGKTLAGSKGTDLQPRDDHGRWTDGGGSTGTGTDNGSHFRHVLAAAGGAVVIAAQAVLKHVIASGAAKLLVRYAVTQFGLPFVVTIAADIALEQVFHHVNKADDGAIAAIENLSDDDARNLAEALFAKLTPDQLVTLSNAVTGSKMNPNHGADGRFASGAGVHAFGDAAAKIVKQKWHSQSARTLKTVEDVYKHVETNKAMLDKAGVQTANETQVHYKGGPIKKISRVLEKIAGGKAVHTVNDIVRSTFYVNSPQEADSVVNSLAKQLPLTDEGFAAKNTGYFDRAVNVQFPNGQLGEVLIMTPQIGHAKDNGGHDLYTGERNLPQGHPLKEVIVKASRDHYAKASNALSPEWAGTLKAIGL